MKYVLFGAGAKWIPELEDENHKAHPLYEKVKDKIDGACKFCAKAFGELEEIQQTDVNLLNDYDDHPSLRSYVQEGYQLVTF